MNSSDDGDIIEIESSTDNESNLNTENQPEAEHAIDSQTVTMTCLRMKLKNQSKKTLKRKRRHKMLPWEEVQLHQNVQSTLEKKAAETKIPKPEKKPQESSSKTKSTKEKINSDPRAPKMATRQGLAAD